jgi:cysteinyl-tRNA synthetase
VFNTLTRKKEVLTPMRPGHVGLYGCGVTVYDDCHLGHAMQAIVFDVIVRYMRFRGYEVTYVRNFTDVDDKVIERAAEKGVPPLELSAGFIRREVEDMDSLGVERPTHAPKVSDHIPQIVAFIERIVERGHAYATERGNVYFHVRSKADYGKLSGRKVDELLVGTRKDVETDKKDPLDFALWKAEDTPGAHWPSPWGEGRPGWHIECSVLGHEFLGEEFDVHGGGLDLVFPHHENEIAQSEAHLGRRHVHYWMHNGLLTLAKEKMSKSTGNFFTIREAVERFGAELIRFSLLQYHYRSHPDFSPRMMAANAGRLHATYEHVQDLLDDLAAYDDDEEGELPAGADGIADPLGSEVRARIADIETRYFAAMDDDFGTPEAVVVLIEGVRYAAECRRRKKTPQADRLRAARAAWERVRELAGPLGIFRLAPADYFAGVRRRFLAWSGLDEAWIHDRIAARAAARAARDWAAADAARDELTAKGVDLRDAAGETAWAVTKDALERMSS